jgi:hypothetical protein
MAEAASLHHHSTATNEHLDLPQSAVHDSHNTNTSRISATQNAVFSNAQQFLHNDHSITSATLEGFASLQDKADAYAKAADLKRIADSRISDSKATVSYDAQATLIQKLEESDARRTIETVTALHLAKEKS